MIAPMTATPPATPPAIGPAREGLLVVGCAVGLACPVVLGGESLDDLTCHNEGRPKPSQGCHSRIGYAECCVQNIESRDIAHSIERPVHPRVSMAD